MRARSSAARSRAAVLSRTRGCSSTGSCGSPFSATSTRCSFSRAVDADRRQRAPRSGISSRLKAEATPLVASSSWRCHWRLKQIGARLGVGQLGHDLAPGAAQGLDLAARRVELGLGAVEREPEGPRFDGAAASRRLRPPGMVARQHAAHLARDLGRDLHDMRLHIGIVGTDEAAAREPPPTRPRDRHQRHGEQQRQRAAREPARASRPWRRRASAAGLSPAPPAPRTARARVAESGDRASSTVDSAIAHIAA